MRLNISFKKLHKWVSILVFIQLFIWLTSGFLLGKVDHSKAAGRNTKIQSTDKMPRFNSELLEIQSIIERYPLATHLQLINFADMPVYRLKISAGRHAYQRSNYVLIDAIEGKLIDLATPEAATTYQALIYSIAQASYEQPLNTQVGQLMLPPIEDLPSERNPVWQFDTQDGESTSIYIRANTAELIAHVNDETRWRDLLLMLHFMDYLQEGSFNNLFIKIFAFLTLILSGTGLWWVYRLVREGQIKWTWRSAHKTLLLRDAQANKSAILTASNNSSVLSTLIDNNIPIRSVCGGGGICGTCKFKNIGDIRITEAEHSLLTKQEIASGVRLSCQHMLSEVTEITLVH